LECTSKICEKDGDGDQPAGLVGLKDFAASRSADDDATRPTVPTTSYQQH